MGSRFGFMLHRTNNEVTFLDNWAEHVANINRRGLLVEENELETYYPIPAMQPDKVKGDFDLVLLFTKAMQIDDMLKQIKPILTENTKVLVLSNGLGNIEMIEQYVSADQIYAGVTLWSSELEGPGHIKVTGSGTIELQPIGTDDETFTTELMSMLNTAGLNAILSSDVLLSIWKKAAFNAVMNTYCALLDCNVGQYGQMQNPMTLAQLVVSEFVAVANAQQIPLTETMVLNTVESVFDPTQSGDHYPSMHQDLQKRRQTEIDYINGAVARIGKSLGIATPVNHLLCELVHAKEDVLGINEKVPSLV